MRTSGILLHLSSLPGPYGIGTMGKEAYAFADFLHAAGQKVWQILPVGPTSYGDSPYQSFSAFAGNPYFIDLDLLKDEGLLTQAELDERTWCYEPGRVSYETIFNHRFDVLRLAYGRDEKAAEAVAAFRKDNAWVEDYALFMALKYDHNMRAWDTWEASLRRRDPKAIAAARERLGGQVDFFIYLQHQFFRQWNALRRYVHAKGIRIVGDMPIYVPYDSADVWCEQELWQLDENGTPTGVAGCPPDAFSADGQLWGNPLYDWDKHKATGFDWWLRRMGMAARLFDVVRIDHFRGLESYWSVPFGDETARNGRWNKGPDKDFVDALRAAYPDVDVIAEDLGFLTQEVLDLVEYSTFPGMKVLQFAFDVNEPGDWMPERYAENTICYIGTHDNATLMQWIDETDEHVVRNAMEYFQVDDVEDLPEAFFRCGMDCNSKLFVAQMQDYLRLGKEARMNLPSTVSTDNWSWRLTPGQLTPELAQTIRDLTEDGNRL